MRCLVIGLNALGRTLALELSAADNEVTVVDREEIRIGRIAERVHRALVMDANDRTALASIDVPSFDEIVVCMSHQFDCAQIAIYLLARVFDHRSVTGFATTMERRTILQKIGARRVISPGIFQARNLAVAVTDPLLEHFTFVSETQGTAEVVLDGPLRLTTDDLRTLFGARIRLVGHRRAGEPAYALATESEIELAKGDSILVFGEPAALGRFVRRQLS